MASAAPPYIRGVQVSSVYTCAPPSPIPFFSVSFPGKSTLAKTLAPQSQIFSTDDFFINKKTEETEYLTSFKGYSHQDDEWLPAETFLGPIPFTSVSRYGRVRQHTTRHLPGEYFFIWYWFNKKVFSFP